MSRKKLVEGLTEITKNYFGLGIWPHVHNAITSAFRQKVNAHFDGVAHQLRCASEHLTQLLSIKTETEQFQEKFRVDYGVLDDAGQWSFVTVGHKEFDAWMSARINMMQKTIGSTAVIHERLAILQANAVEFSHAA